LKNMVLFTVISARKTVKTFDSKVCANLL